MEDSISNVRRFDSSTIDLSNALVSRDMVPVSSVWSGSDWWAGGVRVSVHDRGSLFDVHDVVHFSCTVIYTLRSLHGW